MKQIKKLLTDTCVTCTSDKKQLKTKLLHVFSIYSNKHNDKQDVFETEIKISTSSQQKSIIKERYQNSPKPLGLDIV